MAGLFERLGALNPFGKHVAPTESAQVRGEAAGQPKGMEESPDLEKANLIEYLKNDMGYDLSNITMVKGSFATEDETGQIKLEEYDMEVRPHRDSEPTIQRAYKVRIVWTIDIGEVEPIQYEQDIFTSIHVPDASASEADVVNARLVTIMTTKAYRNSIRGPIDPTHSDYAVLKNKVDQVASSLHISLNKSYEDLTSGRLKGSIQVQIAYTKEDSKGEEIDKTSKLFQFKIMDKPLGRPGKAPYPYNSRYDKYQAMAGRSEILQTEREMRQYREVEDREKRDIAGIGASERKLTEVGRLNDLILQTQTNMEFSERRFLENQETYNQLSSAYMRTKNSLLALQKEVKIEGDRFNFLRDANALKSDQGRNDVKDMKEQEVLGSTILPGMKNREREILATLSHLEYQALSLRDEVAEGQRWLTDIRVFLTKTISPFADIPVAASQVVNQMHTKISSLSVGYSGLIGGIQTSFTDVMSPGPAVSVPSGGPVIEEVDSSDDDLSAGYFSDQGELSVEPEVAEDVRISPFGAGLTEPPRAPGYGGGNISVGSNAFNVGLEDSPTGSRIVDEGLDQLEDDVVEL